VSKINEIKTSDFVKRQTKESRFSHTDLSWDELATLTACYMWNSVEGYKDGVKLVKVPSEGFYSAVANVSDVVDWEEVFEARQEGEVPVRTRVGIVEKKPNAAHVDIVLYRCDVLAEDVDYVKEGDHEWEIISINARLTDKPHPIPPITMARNFLTMKGGTKAEYSAEEFAESIWFWNSHCLTKER
jgi:hypothetical protein